MNNDAAPLRQLLYISSSNEEAGVIDVAKIVAISRRNNAMDGVTGLLWTDQKRFLQVLEGPSESVAMTFDRIRQDPRHKAVVVLHDREIDTRQFGDWTMAARGPADSADDFDAKIARLLENASDSVRSTFEGLISARG